MAKIRLLLIALIGASLIFLLNLLLFQKPSRENRSIEILVASQDIPAGTYLKPEMVVKTEFPAYLINSNEIMDLQEVAGLQTLFLISKGKPIVYTQFPPTEKAQSPIQSHNPLNFTLTINAETKNGKLYKPGTIDSYLGKFTGIKSGEPIALFPKVQSVYKNIHPIHPFGYAENKTFLYSITPTQADELKLLAGKPIQLMLSGVNGDEILKISSLNK